MDDKYLYLNQIIESLGISEFDGKVYQAILKHGPMTIISLARELKVERPTIYAALERLRSFGLAPQLDKAYSRKITVEPPTRLLSLLEKQKTTLTVHEDNLQKILPNLLAEMSARSQNPIFRIFEGRQQFLSIFEESLRETKDEILFLGDASTFINYEGIEYEKDWIKRRIAKRIPMRILVFKDDLTQKLHQLDHKQLRQTRFLPQTHQFSGSFMTYGNRVLLWNPLAERAFILEDQIICKMFINIFELNWHFAQYTDQHNSATL